VAARRARLRRLLAILGGVVLLVVVAVAAWVAHLDGVVKREFEGRRWSVPARVYAEPLELYAGAAVTPEDLEQELERLHYRAGDPAAGPGLYRRHGGSFELHARRVRFVDELRPATRVVVRDGAGGIAGIATAAGAEVPLFRLDPLVIGNISPVHGEDRLVLAPDEVPPLLRAALKAVEDKRFDEHHGIDPHALLRAVWANLRAGRIAQGGSTITQQLVKNFFLTEEQTLSRKLTEAVMALRLEARFSKDEILVAYVNEVYLGQQGERAIHGFGLGSEFYFGKPLAELDAGELALLVGLVKGPSYYEPRKHPERARARRDVVLGQLAEAGLVTPAAARAAAAGPLRLAAPGGAYVPAFLDLVRRHLKRDYAEADLAAAGLGVYTTLDPRAQAAAERALTRQLRRLDAGQPAGHGAPLQGAVVVAEPHGGDVLAVVGGRDLSFDGFNRALDARRPIGSLVKPAVYLAALASGRYHAASLIEDAPLEIRLGDGSTWAPQNYTHETYGTVPLVRALAESMNLATVRLGLAVGVPRVLDTLVQLGVERRPAANPSVLLGTVELAPLEVVQVYAALANGGFKARLRAVRAVLDDAGRPLRSFPMQVEPAAAPAAVYALDRMLTQVIARGTGRGAAARLPAGLVAPAKTGTSSDTRDSWFAGFTGSHLAVAWVGYDDNRATGLTGASGAMPVWAELMATLRAASWEPPPPDGVEQRWVDYQSGAESDAACAPAAVAVALPPATILPPARAGCGTEPAHAPGVAERVKSWLQNVLR
jgi:penicillin-binding protein 1B